jgi:hypothetical protein
MQSFKWLSVKYEHICPKIKQLLNEKINQISIDQIN